MQYKQKKIVCKGMRVLPYYKVLEVISCFFGFLQHKKKKKEKKSKKKKRKGGKRKEKALLFFIL